MRTSIIAQDFSDIVFLGGNKPKPLLYTFRPTDYKGDLIKPGLRIYQEGREIVTLNPFDLLRCQSSYNALKADYYASRMRTNGWGNFTPLDVIRTNDGRLFTFDHKRWVAAKNAGIGVQALIHEAKELLPAKFAESRVLFNRGGIVTTWEDAIEFRIQKQSKYLQEPLRQGKLEVKPQ